METLALVGSRMEGGSGRSGDHGKRQTKAQSCFTQRLSCGVMAKFVPLLPGGFDGEWAGMLGAARGHLPSPGLLQPHRVICHPHGQDGLCRSCLLLPAHPGQDQTRAHLSKAAAPSSAKPVPNHPVLHPTNTTSLQPASCNRPPPAPGLSCCSRAQLHGLGVPRHPHRGGDPGARLGPRCSAEGAEMLGREPGASRLHQHPSLGMLRGVSRRNGDSGTGHRH